MNSSLACARCGGLLRIEPVRRRGAPTLHLWACFTCGDRTDATILANRRSMAAEETHDWKAALWERIRMLARVACAA